MNNQTIQRLKQLYELENFQITYYTSLLSTPEDKLYRKALSKIIHTKKKHKDFLAELFLHSDIPVPKIVGTLANLAGSLIGESLEFTGQDNSRKVGFVLEKKAHHVYNELISDTELDPKLQDNLMNFLLDEEFHALWLQNYLQRSKQNKLHQNSFLVDQTGDHPTININMGWH